MATYDKTEFFWLKLKEDFFEEQTIRWIEKQPKGKEYAYFYLKLCVKSLKTNGVLVQRVGSKLIPFDDKALAEFTFTDIDTVRVAVNLFLEIGLIEKLDNGFLYMKEVENLIGSQSKGAFKKQQQRIKNSQSNISYTKQLENGVGDKSPLLCPPELEKELELEIDVCVCQRKKDFKDNTCKDCWNYYKCNRQNYAVYETKKEEKKQAELYGKKQEDKIEEETKSIEELENFFKVRNTKKKA